MLLWTHDSFKNMSPPPYAIVKQSGVKWDLHLSSSHASPSSFTQTHSRAAVADPEVSREKRAVKFAKLQRSLWDFKPDVRKYFDFSLSANETNGEELTDRQAKI